MVRWIFRDCYWDPDDPARHEDEPADQQQDYRRDLPHAETASGAARTGDVLRVAQLIKHALQWHCPGRPRLGDMFRDLAGQLAPAGPGHRPRGAAEAPEVAGRQLVISHGLSFSLEPRRVSTLSLSRVQSRVNSASAARPAAVSW